MKTTKQLTISNLDIRLIKKMKIHCVKNEVQINKFVADAISEKLNKEMQNECAKQS